MSERKDEKWLDDQLRRAVDGTTPAFDAESWKRKHRREYEALLARGKKASHPSAVTSRVVRLVLRGPFGKLAAAAAIIVLAGVFSVSEPGRMPERPIDEPRSVAQGPEEMLSMMSLRMAYQQGGFEALDQQLQDTLDTFRPRSSGVSMQELF